MQFRSTAAGHNSIMNFRVFSCLGEKRQILLVQNTLTSGAVPLFMLLFYKDMSYYHILVQVVVMVELEFKYNLIIYTF